MPTAPPLTNPCTLRPRPPRDSAASRRHFTRRAHRCCPPATRCRRRDPSACRRSGPSTAARVARPQMPRASAARRRASPSSRSGARSRLSRAQSALRAGTRRLPTPGCPACRTRARRGAPGSSSRRRRVSTALDRTRGSAWRCTTTRRGECASSASSGAHPRPGAGLLRSAMRWGPVRYLCRVLRAAGC